MFYVKFLRVFMSYKTWQDFSPHYLLFAVVIIIVVLIIIIITINEMSMTFRDIGLIPRLSMTGKC